MRKNFGVKPILYPLPVLIVGTYNEDGTPNAMNAAWGGITGDNEITICIGDDHKTSENLLHRGAFTVSVGTASQVIACDYLGIVSGTKVVDKVARSGLHCIKSEFVDAPLFNELPVALECRLVSYDLESCHLVGTIVNVCADESVLNNKGNIDPAILQPITYDPTNHEYLVLGEKVGNAFRDGAALK